MYCECPLCFASGSARLATIGRLSYHRCPICELTFLNPRQFPTPAEELAEYRLHRNDPNDPGYRRHLSKLVDPLLPRLKPDADGLDYGCGPAPTISVLMDEQGFRVRDYDPFFRPDEFLLSRMYDFITCTEVAEHFHHPGREFDRLATMLRPGGTLGLMTQLLTDDIEFASWWYVREIGHVSFYRPNTVSWIGRQFGLLPEILSKSTILLTKSLPRQCPQETK